MAFKSDEHSDLSLFRNRLWHLMENRGLYTAKDLATALHDAGFKTVDINPVDNVRSNAIFSMSRRIQEHLNQDNTDKLQSRYVVAYCNFFGCSADYLFGRSNIESGNIDVRRFCECTGLSEKAVRRLIEEISPEAKESLTEFWSHMLESQVFYAFPMEFFMMCTERGLYEASQRKIKAINTALDKIETGSEFDAVYRSMMNDEYQKLAAPHEGAYHMHLNEILFNMSEFLEMWAKENVEVNKKKHARMLSEMIEKTAQEDKERFMRSMGMEEGPEDTTSYD